MDRKTSLTILIAFLLASCSNAEIPPTLTSTPISTEIPKSSPTPTEIPATKVATELKEGDTYTETVNGHEYVYTYTKIGETPDGETVFADVRTWVVIYMVNEPRDNWISWTIRSTSATPGDTNVVSMVNKDFTTADIPLDGKWNPLPISSVYRPALMDRYFEGDSRPLTDVEKQIAFKLEILGEGEKGREQAKIPITIAVMKDGVKTTEDLNVILSDHTGGIDLLITDKDTMFALAEDPSFVSTGYVEGIEYYAEVYGVDKDGKMLCRLAFSVPLSEVPDKALRKAIFIFPASLAAQKDQTEIGQTELSKILAHMSEQKRIDAKQDLVIERAPAQQ